MRNRRSLILFESVLLPLGGSFANYQGFLRASTYPFFSITQWITSNRHGKHEWIPLESSGSAQWDSSLPLSVSDDHMLCVGNLTGFIQLTSMHPCKLSLSSVNHFASTPAAVFLRRENSGSLIVSSQQDAAQASQMSLLTTPDNLIRNRSFLDLLKE